MHVLTVRNVHEALPRAITLLHQIGVKRDSRNGPVLFGGTVSTIYTNPIERVIFWPERDANPFFHLYESLWMLAGRNDLAGPNRYAKNIANYSDDGQVLHGAYGHRWRKNKDDGPDDQLLTIADTLINNKEDRRCVLQMWDKDRDLGNKGKDLPCNTMATFQRGPAGELNLTVFCRSNDIVWGAYGANAVQFGALLEYMATWIKCPIGTYTQISVNWHAYLDTLKGVSGLCPDKGNYVFDPYAHRQVVAVPMPPSRKQVDDEIAEILEYADKEILHTRSPEALSEWGRQVWIVLDAHEAFRQKDEKDRMQQALKILERGYSYCDWIIAAQQWIKARIVRAEFQSHISHP